MHGRPQIVETTTIDRPDKLANRVSRQGDFCREHHTEKECRRERPSSPFHNLKDGAALRVENVESERNNGQKKGK